MNTREPCKNGFPDVPRISARTEPEDTQPHWRALTGITVALLLSACGSMNSQNAQPDTNNTSAGLVPAATVSVVNQTMAADIILTTSQIFNPFTTTLQVSNSNDEPLQAYFIEQFAKAGYGIQRVSADQGSNFFSLAQTEVPDEDGKPLIRIATTIGAVDISRDYRVPRANTISPASPVRLSGTRIPVDILDQPNEGFLVADGDNSKAVYMASLNLDEQAPPVISLITDDLVEQVAEQSTQTSSLQALNSSRIEINNLFYADQSNFSSVLDDYEQIERQIVVFGNDSMILGNTNKLLIEQFVQQRIGSDDLISLVGCSNGPTALEIGNEGLALGRAERVTQALLSQGVARDRILDEGCWAPVSAGEKFPGRGVVLELWRKLS